MVSSKEQRSCMDNPNKPHKAFRDIISKRSKKNREAILQKLTPALRKAFEAYCSHGKTMHAETKRALLGQLGDSVIDALDGEFDTEHLECAYCAFDAKERMREKSAVDAGSQVRRIDACLPTLRIRAARPWSW